MNQGSTQKILSNIRRKKWFRIFCHFLRPFISFVGYRFTYFIAKHMWFIGEFKVSIGKNIYFKMIHYGAQIENEFFWYGFNKYESYSMKLWSELSKVSNTILDVGANTGLYSITSKALNKNAKVIAFEPVERNFEKLKRNIQLNRMDIVAEKVALSSKSGTSYLFDFDLDLVYAATLEPTVEESAYSKKYLVSVTTIDQYVSENRIDKVDLIKIDVETHEPEVLLGYSEYFSIHKPIILIEVLFDNVGEKIQSFIEQYSQVKYSYFFVHEEFGLQQFERINRKSDTYFNYLLIPEDKLFLLERFGVK